MLRKNLDSDLWEGCGDAQGRQQMPEDEILGNPNGQGEHHGLDNDGAFGCGFVHGAYLIALEFTMACDHENAIRVR